MRCEWEHLHRCPICAAMLTPCTHHIAMFTMCTDLLLFCAGSVLTPAQKMLGLMQNVATGVLLAFDTEFYLDILPTAGRTDMQTHSLQSCLCCVHLHLRCCLGCCPLLAEQTCSRQQTHSSQARYNQSPCLGLKLHTTCTCCVRLCAGQHRQVLGK